MIHTASGPVYVPDTFPGLAPPEMQGMPAGPSAMQVPSVLPQLPPEVLANMGLDAGFGQPGPGGIGAGGGIADPFPLPAQTTPDYVPPPAKVKKLQASDAKGTQAYDAGAPQRAAVQRQRVAYDASPEGRIASSTQTQQDILGDQTQVAGMQGEVAGQEADDNRAELERRTQAIDKQRLEAEQAEQERKRGLADLTEQRTKAIDAEANYKIDDNRRWNDLGTGRKLMVGIGAIMSGLGEALQRKSGPNPVLGMITDAIHEDVAAQVRERDNLGRKVGRLDNSLDRYAKQTGDMREAAHMKIAEEYKRTADQFELTAAKYANPKAKLNAMAAANELRMRAAALTGQSAEQQFARDMQRGQLTNSQNQVGLGYANLKQGKYEFGENMKLHVREQLLKAQEFEQQGNVAGAKALQAQAAKDNELGMSAPTQLKRDAQGNILTDDSGAPLLDRSAMLVNADNSTWHAPDKETRKVLADKMSAAHELASILDEAAQIRDNVGGESAAGNSDEFQRLKVLQNRAIVLAKSGTQGMSSDEDMKKLSEMLGAADLASFRSQAAGLEQGRKQLVSELNTSLHFQGNYSGKPIDIPNLSKAKGPQNTEQDETYKATISKPAVSFDQAYDQAIRPAQEAYRRDVKTDRAGAELALTAASAKAKKQAENYKDITPAQTDQIHALAETITSGTPQAKINARLMLSRVATDGQTPAIRKAASDALGEAQIGTGAIETPPTGRSVSYEDAPPPKGK